MFLSSAADDIAIEDALGLLQQPLVRGYQKTAGPDCRSQVVKSRFVEGRA